MEFNSDEKLYLFLIWWHIDNSRDISELERGNILSDDVILGCINENDKFNEFISEAHGAKVEFEFWVSNFDLEDIKESTIVNTPMLSNDRDHYYKNKIKIIIEG